MILVSYQIQQQCQVVKLITYVYPLPPPPLGVGLFQKVGGFRFLPMCRK